VKNEATKIWLLKIPDGLVVYYESMTVSLKIILILCICRGCRKWPPKWREKPKGMQVIGRTGSLRAVSKVVECVNSAKRGLGPENLENLTV
jgi:hypothetical protein